MSEGAWNYDCEIDADLYVAARSAGVTDEEIITWGQALPLGDYLRGRVGGLTHAELFDAFTYCVPLWAYIPRRLAGESHLDAIASVTKMAEGKPGCPASPQELSALQAAGLGDDPYWADLIKEGVTVDEIIEAARAGISVGQYGNLRCQVFTAVPATHEEIMAAVREGMPIDEYQECCSHGERHEDILARWRRVQQGWQPAPNSVVIRVRITTAMAVGRP